jgi:hypothetical protein
MIQILNVKSAKRKLEFNANQGLKKIVKYSE